MKSYSDQLDSWKNRWKGETITQDFGMVMVKGAIQTLYNTQTNTLAYKHKYTTKTTETLMGALFDVVGSSWCSSWCVTTFKLVCYYALMFYPRLKVWVEHIIKMFEVNFRTDKDQFYPCGGIDAQGRLCDL